jgi:hypothetical protein
VPPSAGEEAPAPAIPRAPRWSDPPASRREIFAVPAEADDAALDLETDVDPDEPLDADWLDEYDEAEEDRGTSLQPFAPRAPRVLPKAPGAREVLLVAAGLGAIAVAIPLLRGDLFAPEDDAGSALPPVTREHLPTPPPPSAPAATPPAGTPAAPPNGPDQGLRLMNEPLPEEPAVEGPEPSPPAAVADDSGILVPLAVQVDARPQARIEVDGVDVGRTPIASIPLIPGDHIFRARMADGRIVERVVRIHEDNRQILIE